MIMQNICNEESQYLHIGNDDDWIVNVMITTMIAMTDCCDEVSEEILVEFYLFCILQTTIVPLPPHTSP